MPPITIPPEALEAAENAVREALEPGYPAGPRYIARAACLAMLRSWPGAWTQTVMSEPMCYSLPLNTEQPND
jgi:hypothetical protein